MSIGGKSLLSILVLASFVTTACSGASTSPTAPTTAAGASLGQGQSQTESGSGGGGGSTATACTFINDFKVTSGYTPSSNSSLGAVWVQWKLNSCASPSGQGINIRVNLTEKATGVLVYSVPGMLAQQTIDFDNQKTGTAYHVDFTITDAGTGLPIVSRSADTTTPSHNAAGI